MPSGPESITSVFGITPLKMPNQVSASSPNLRSSRMFSRHAWTNAGRCVIAVATTAASPVAVTFLDMFGQTYCRPPKVGAGRRGYNCIHGKMAQMKDCEYRRPRNLSFCSGLLASCDLALFYLRPAMSRFGLDTTLRLCGRYGVHAIALCQSLRRDFYGPPAVGDGLSESMPECLPAHARCILIFLPQIIGDSAMTSGDNFLRSLRLPILSTP